METKQRGQTRQRGGKAVKNPDYKAGMVNLIVLALLALVLIGVMIQKWAVADYNGVAVYLGFLFMDFGISLYSYRVAVLDGFGYKEVKD